MHARGKRSAARSRGWQPAQRSSGSSAQCGGSRCQAQKTRRREVPGGVTELVGGRVTRQWPIRGIQARAQAAPRRPAALPTAASQRR